MRRSPWVVLLVCLCFGVVAPAQGSTWDRIGRYLKVIEAAGVEPLVANDCPQGLLGAFHQGRRVLLMCGNNLPDDPAYLWVVLAHESAHVMQFCKGGTLLPPSLLSSGMDQARLQQPNAFQELNLYHSSQHRVEAEARLVQALPPEQVEALFFRHCGDRLQP